MQRSRAPQAAHTSLLACIITLIITLGASAQQITIKNPSAGDTLLTGDTTIIRWSASGITGQLGIRLSTDNGETYSDITSGSMPDAADTGYAWVVPDAQSSQCFLEMSDYFNSSTSDVVGPFWIMGGGSTPSIVLSQTSVTCHGDSVFDVTACNGGGGALPSLSVTDDASWLTLTLDSSHADTVIITNTVNATGVADGTHLATVSVSGSGVSTRTYSVT
ncbi:MAG: hypothetical protein GF331_23715, partial [Chitinivibrionales bacterium]|nr:hypothetical protein [Chitinivibrionales bacterium]